MDLPEEITAGDVVLVMTKVSRSADNYENEGCRLNCLCLVGEYQPGRDTEWFLSPLENYDTKKLRVDAGVVAKGLHDYKVFVRLGESTFRQYTRKESSLCANVKVCAEAFDGFSGTSPFTSHQSSCISSHCTTPGTGSRSDTQVQFIADGSTPNVFDGSHNTVRTPSPTSGYAGEASRDAGENQESENTRNGEGRFLPSLRPPRRPSVGLGPRVKSTGSLRFRRILESL
ncbi:hypothetical protein DQ04_03481090 [Trypanosoma grayi]|uniref:hypothetical protein n=1 Tax=Trypanosoma grayi TaxID=71804 RepID=UPI0004F415B6|nr:hypothetical protein DQ04_03481090 [Trypanosoma grayi]KEG10639.1 hypothetical protein DQ04_03481090 [Trypanosoma grayi]